MARVAVVAGLLLLAAASHVGAQTCVGTPAMRQDCGFVGITESECLAKSCCWSPIESDATAYPWCFYPEKECGHYDAGDLVQTATGFVANLTFVGEPCEYFGPDIPNLILLVDYETESRLHVKIYDADDARWEVPDFVVERAAPSSRATNPAYKIDVTASPFSFAVSRASGEVIFNTSAVAGGNFHNLVFEDQYLELSTHLPDNAYIYGLGERVRPLRLSTGLMYTMWAADEPTPVNQNVYGSHPFYVEMRDGQAHGVLLLNSNGMDVALHEGSLTYHVIGGVLDLYFFMGPTPTELFDQYTEFVGRPYMIPYWALGWHQCRYGYPNLDTVKSVVAQYEAASIPLEAMWIDIDYMDEFKDWTFDPVNYPQAEVKAFVDELHNKSMRNVLIVDPAIKTEKGYKYYDMGLEQDIFIKSASTGEPMVGMVWPMYTVFPDFLHPGIHNYWGESLADFWQLVDVDGLWVDMNEPASFCYGSDLSTCDYPSKRRGAAIDEMEEQQRARHVRSHPGRRASFDPNTPPYAINNANYQAPLARKTTDADAYHYDGTLEYDAHNIYGVAEMYATVRAFEQLRNRRAFVLSRSTFPGAGKYGGHWTGDNWSTWEQLYYSIPGMLQFQMFGIPFVGADVCGFIGDTNEELCARWTLVGAFYPFSRNHNALGYISQEPYLWPQVAQNARHALGIRYALLPYYYTLFHQAHTSGATVVRALFFEFPDDVRTYDNDRQFMVGGGILISPVLSAGATSVSAYFPEGVWFDYFTRTVVSDTAQWKTLTANIGDIPIHIRGGHIIPHQFAALTTAASRKNDYYLIIAFDAKGNNATATGTLYIDDGESLGGSYTSITFTARHQGTSVTLSSSGTFAYHVPQVLKEVTVMDPSGSKIFYELALPLTNQFTTTLTL